MIKLNVIHIWRKANKKTVSYHNCLDLNSFSIFVACIPSLGQFSTSLEQEQCLKKLTDSLPSPWTYTTFPKHNVPSHELWIKVTHTLKI